MADNNISRSDFIEPSIYQGADIKLEAFDRFHKVLNQCDSGVNFSIKDAAFLLKQLTPDILRKIIPVISHEARSPKKKCMFKNTDIYEESGVDDEVSKINELNKNVVLEKKLSSIKRPDASRPTRMLSPGSNSCSPVSAAVQALISISAPVADKTNTITNTLANNSNKFVEDKDMEDAEISCENLFVPVSKASVSTAADFGDSAFAPVPKSISFSREPFEVEEVLFTSKSNSTLVSVMNEIVVSTSCMTKVSSNHPVISVFSQPIEPSFSDTFKTTATSLITADDPLPNFGLLLASGLPSITGELPNTIPFPFSQHLPPGSPMHQVATTIACDQNYTSASLNSQINDSPNSSQQKHDTVQSAVEPLHNADEISLPKSVMEPIQDANFNNRQIFRTILPKPSNLSHSVTSSNTSLVSVLPSAAIASSLNTPLRAMQNNDKLKMKTVQSVPPSQIFTKINASALPPSLAHFLSQQQHRGLITNQNLFLSPTSVSSNQASTSTERNMGVIKKDVTLGHFFANIQTGTVSVKHDSAGRGKLEVASALLSMGTQDTGDSSKEPQSLVEMIQDNLKKCNVDAPVLILEDGILKVDDLDLDPSKHVIEKDNFACGKCNKVFTSIIYLIKHIKRVCPDMSQRKWKCDKCSKAFSHPFGLQQHSYTHTGERPYKCTQCSKAFYSSNDLRRHVRTHSGEKPYKCELCAKAFSTTISLRTHTYTHTGERPHKCPRCTKAFSTSSKLSRHLVTHLDKKPFPCDQCEKRFNRSGDLRRHYKEHHGLSHSLFECDHCHKVFASKKSLLTHETNHHKSCNVVSDNPLLS